MATKVHLKTTLLARLPASCGRRRAGRIVRDPLLLLSLDEGECCKTCRGDSQIIVDGRLAHARWIEAGKP